MEEIMVMDDNGLEMLKSTLYCHCQESATIFSLWLAQ